MQASDIPYKFAVPWASAATVGYVNTIPATATGGSASQELGFPPITAAPTGAGGIPPDIADMNGALLYATQWAQWAQAGGPIGYDGTFSTDVGGYPKAAVVSSASVAGNYWLSTAENNTTDPDAGGANWTGFSVLPTGDYAADTGAANAYVVAPSPALALVTGTKVRWKAANANSGNSTLNVSGTGALTIWGASAAALQGGEIVAGGIYETTYDGSRWVLTGAGEGAFAIQQATASRHALRQDQQLWTASAVSALAASLLNSGGTLGADLSDFAISIGVDGYIKLPAWLGGLIIQWGTATFGPMGGAWTFPIPFPNAMLCAVGVNQGDAINNDALHMKYLGLESVQLDYVSLNSGTAWCIAIGN